MFLVHPKLLKAVRILLDISGEDLAMDAKISLRSLRALEIDTPKTTKETIEAVQRALQEKHGVIFLGEDENFGVGFRLPRSSSKKRSTSARPAKRARFTNKLLKKPSRKR